MSAPTVAREHLFDIPFCSAKAAPGKLGGPPAGRAQILRPPSSGAQTMRPAAASGAAMSGGMPHAVSGGTEGTGPCNEIMNSNLDWLTETTAIHAVETKELP